MGLEVIMVMENWEGTETNFLTDLRGYMEMAMEACGGSAADMADAIGQLYGTKDGSSDWGGLYFAGNKSVHAAICRDVAQLRGFLMGDFNEGEWSFDEGRCQEGCLEVLRSYGMGTDGHSLPMRYERVGHAFHVGELLHNMNGKDYRVLALLGPRDLLLAGQVDSQLVVGRGVQLYKKYPNGERPGNGSIVTGMMTGIEWDYGIYLGDDITRLDLDILRQEYGEPGRVENISDLWDRVQRDFWMHKNVEQKDSLAMRVRMAARDGLGELFRTADPEVFQAMLDKGMYDRMYHVKEEQKKMLGRSR